MRRSVTLPLETTWAFYRGATSNPLFGMFQIVAIVALLFAVTPAAADASAAWDALRKGGYVALMRHGDAPGGAGDPAGFKLDDCSTQRNLSERGRAEAVAMGAQIRAKGISFTRIISSPWCRCVETAKLMDLGPVDIEPAFSNAFVLRDRRDELRRDATAILNTWSHGTLMVVTHGANIQALSGVSPTSAEIVVGDPLTARVIGRIPAPN
jgi:phosphohistidine phosphatase SixA